MYWTDYTGSDIRRANLDGTGVTTILSGLKNPAGLALDLVGGQIYWTDNGGGDIQRANLDGSGQQILVAGLSGPYGLALDLIGGKMYWANYRSQDIQRANLDGSGQEVLVHNLNSPIGIALDLARGQMYWTDNGGGDIRRANFDGTGQVTLIKGLTTPNGIALDLGAPGPAVFFAIVASASVVSGQSFDLTVTALDPYGNIDSNYQGTVSFSSSDAYPGLLPADYTFTSADQGTHTFSGGVTLYTAGAQRLTTQDAANSSLTGSASVAVVAAPASQLLITAPANAISGTPFDVMLAALDPYGNVDMNYGGTVTWTSSDTDPAVLLPADYTFQPTDNGMVTFPAGVTLVTLGSQILTATDTVSGITSSSTIMVGP
jgi:hypothetical protein